MCTSRPSAERPAILRKNLGSKLIKMEFTDTREAGRSVKTLDVARNCAPSSPSTTLMSKNSPVLP